MTAQCVQELQRTDWSDALDSELAAWWLDHADVPYTEQQDSGDLLFYLSAASKETSCE